jgi:hypothetical protein
MAQSADAAREADNNITKMGATNTNAKNNYDNITKTVEVQLDVEIDMEALLKPCLALQQQQPQDMELS